ncbi:MULTISPECIES: SGNH/GDSL hydrolase family protein [unclassified Aeromicrobium]|uniref:SGNH/GDSL hydrolase family protein n=1 Tax=unclassified Aeromicrobium TaxID=2633570 RepID=UPI00288A9BA5|nr:MULTISPECIES: SGNH/GDSL hydrolase family protein [unclassified Aeromicrobium]
MRFLRTLIPILTAAALALGVACWPSTAQSTTSPKMLVYGDSTSSWYNEEPGSPSEGWWAIVARQLGADVTLSAEHGSGMWARGNKCQGTRLADRLGEVGRVRPDIIIVAMGFNDDHGCDANNRKVPIYESSSKRAVDIALTALAARVDAAGLDRSTVYVTTPWGSSKMDVHYWMWREQKAVAERLGFTYVTTMRFNDREQTVDTVHQNRPGNLNMAARFLAGMPS